MQFQTVMWRPRCRNRTQADEAADTVVNVNDNVSGIQGSNFADKVPVPLTPLGMANETITKNILFCDNNELACIESSFKRQDACCNFVASKRFNGAQIFDQLDLLKTMLAQNLNEPVPRSL